MFDLRRPCKTCPFKRGGLCGLRPPRILEILEAPAFQCHNTVLYGAGPDGDDIKNHAKTQQCVGLIAFLHLQGRRNQITEVAARLSGYDPAAIDNSEVCTSLGELLAQHGRCDAS